MTPARKLRIWTGQDGLCGCGCGDPVDLQGPGVRYDHTIPFEIAPHLDDDGPNVKAVITAHDALKTYGRDMTWIAKTKRQAKMRLDVPRETAGSLRGGRKLPSKGQGPKLQSRGFGGGRRPFRRV